MKFHLARGSFIFILFCITFFPITTRTVQADDVEDFVTKLKTHYQEYPQLDAFALNYHYLGREDPYSAWDYRMSERYMALRMVEIDLVRKHFFENDIHHFPDGKTFNRIQFQNDKESLFYDKNGLTLGKRIIRQSMDSFEELKGFLFGNVDFLAVTPLLEEPNIKATITVQHDKLSERTTLVHTVSDNNTTEYVFRNSPLQLISINKKSQQRRFVYGDYQTTDGITFARSIHKYFGGEASPSFIHRIDQLRILDKIEPVRFQVPEDFGPIIPETDRNLVSKKIAEDTFLVTDASALRNILFKVNGDEIMLFGVPASTKLAEQTIKLILDQFPNKKITSVYVTHPHAHHIAGLPAFAKRNITIRADVYTIDAIKAYPRFAEDIATFNFETIEHDEVIDDVRFYVLESTHSKRQSFAYFENSAIIYQANFLEVPFDNSIAKIIPSYTKAFIDFVRSKHLKINRIVGHHRNNNISVETMNKVYEARH